MAKELERERALIFQIRLDIRINFFTERMVSHWNKNGGGIT